MGTAASTADSGLHARIEGYDSVLTDVGTAVNGHMTLAGAPVTFFAKAAWEREWTADPSVQFNLGNVYAMDFKESRLVYGLGVEGSFGQGNSWHVDASRSHGDVFADHWRVNAGVRFPF